MNVHVLVLAMSELHNLPESKYQYCPENGIPSRQYTGYGQLEVIPQFIQDYLNQQITHIVILETGLTRQQLSGKMIEKLNELQKTNASFLQLKPDESVEELTAVSFFQKRMTALGINPEYIEIDLDVKKPQPALEKLLREIRKLYRLTQESGGDWKLWLDIHGGFREISMAMFSLIQVLSATDMAGFPKIQDNNKIVPVDGVYTTLFNHGDDVTQIFDRTDFYSDFTTPSLKEYLNYGQYLKTMLKPDEGNHEYAFISYKHREAEKERLAVMCLLKESGIRYWYDDDLHIGEKWAKKLHEKLTSRKNVLFIALISESYTRSPQCLKELRTALDYHKKVVLVSLDKTRIDFKEPLCGYDGTDRIEISLEELDNLGEDQHLELENSIVEGILDQRHFLDALITAVPEEIDLCRRVTDVTGRVSPDPGIRYFVNLSNHPSEKWNDTQRKAAEEIGPIADVPFPHVDPLADDKEIERIAKEVSKSVMEYHPKAVMVQGETTLLCTLVKQLQKHGVDCLAACTDRKAKEYTNEEGHTIKNSDFSFVQFRKYPQL